MTARNLLLLKNLRLLEPAFDEPRDGYEVLIEGERIKEVSDRRIASAAADVIDCGGRVMHAGSDRLPRPLHAQRGLHAADGGCAADLAAARGAKRLKEMLDRGFTTVRDTGGTDWGMKTAVEPGLIPARACLSRPLDRPHRRPHATAVRGRTQAMPAPAATAWPICAWWPTARTRCASAVREQMRQGCDHVKIMVSGGVASPYDPLESLQFSAAEI